MSKRTPRPDLPAVTRQVAKLVNVINTNSKRRRFYTDQQIGKIPAQDLQLKMELQEWRCIYCRDKISFSNCELDHVHPMCKGGAHFLYNVFFTCRSCNSHKRARTVKRFCDKMHFNYEEIRQHMAEIDQKLHDIFFPAEK